MIGCFTIHIFCRISVRKIRLFCIHLDMHSRHLRRKHIYTMGLSCLFMIPLRRFLWVRSRRCYIVRYRFLKRLLSWCILRIICCDFSRSRSCWCLLCCLSVGLSVCLFVCLSSQKKIREFLKKSGFYPSTMTSELFRLVVRSPIQK